MSVIHTELKLIKNDTKTQRMRVNVSSPAALRTDTYSMQYKTM